MISLFEPVTFRNYEIPSRILLAPINTGYAQNGLPTPRLIRFQELRSDSSIGISMVGNVAVSDRGLSNENTLVLDDAASIGAYRELAERIRSRGSLPGIQLAYSPSSLQPNRGWIARDRGAEVARLQTIIQSLNGNEIKDALNAFYAAATLTYESSYDVIQLHCAHGYFLSLLLDPRINTRGDDYSADGPWVEDFFQTVRRLTTGRLLSVRLSATTGLSDRTLEQAATVRLAKFINGCGIDLIDFSAGYYTIDRNLIYPAKDSDTGTFPLSRSLSEDVECLVSFAGQASNLEFFETEISPRQLVAIGRAFIADPDFAKKYKSSRCEEINHCKSCRHCHYFSRGRTNLECGVNPDL
jgi:2,4-dienoyl-CoA reductase-like NADH-dependent reductase (Old Yellow Enzyme family)